MKSVRILGAALLMLALAIGLSACQKQADTEVTTTTDNPATATEMPATPSETVTPPAEPPPTPAVTTTPKKTTTKPKSKSTGAVLADVPTTLELPAGTTFNVVMVTPVDTRTSNVGDKIEATLAAPLYVNGKTVANQDAVIRGEISELTRASRAKSEEDRAGVKFLFTSLETVDGEKVLHATVTNSEGRMIAKSTSTRDKLLIGGGALLGAITGKVAGKDTKATVLGAVGGAVLGTGIVLASKGHELEVPAGSKVSLRVDEPITIVEK
jgi:hypothetical protein